MSQWTYKQRAMVRISGTWFDPDAVEAVRTIPDGARLYLQSGAELDLKGSSNTADPHYRLDANKVVNFMKQAAAGEL